MKKVIKWLAIIVVSLIVIAMIGFQVAKHQTKKHSPQATTEYTENGYDIRIEYSRPFKKDREIFGGLVPYGEIWRTGANEATTFHTGTDLKIDGKTLPAGDYTLWTIPGPKDWQVIFNKGEYGWGLNFDGTSPLDQSQDVLVTTVPKLRNFKVLEQFTIEVKPNNELKGAPAVLMLGWDFTRADVVLYK